MEPFIAPPVAQTQRFLTRKIKSVWTNASSKSRVYLSLLLLLFAYLCTYWICYRVIGGFLNFLASYIRVLAGAGIVPGACRRIESESWPLLMLSDGDYFRLQRCLGSKAGFDRQGQLLAPIYDLYNYIFSTFGDSMLIVLIVLTLFYLNLNDIKSQTWYFLHSIHTYHSHTPAVIICSPVLSAAMLFALAGFSKTSVVTFLVSVGAGSFIYNSRKYNRSTISKAWADSRSNTVLEKIRTVARKVHSARRVSVSRPMAGTGGKECDHPEKPRSPCFAGLGRKIEAEPLVRQSIADDRDRIQQDVEHSQIFSARLQDELDWTKQKAKRYEQEAPKANSQPYKTGCAADISIPMTPLSPQAFSGLSAHSSHQAEPDKAARLIEGFKTDVEHALSAIKRLEKEKTSLYQVIDKMQIKLNYATGAGEDYTRAKDEAVAMNLKYRTLLREHQEVNLIAMQLRHDLAKERLTGSGACQNEASCQIAIREWQDKAERLMAVHKENDILVCHAAYEFGIPLADAKHYTLRRYLNEVTLELIRLRAAGVKGADTTSVEVQYVSNQLVGYREYVPRLEAEYERLGGNIMEVRMGLDTTRPLNMRGIRVSYDTNAARIFDIYTQLTEKVGKLTDIHTHWNLAPPARLLEPVRNDQTSGVHTTAGYHQSLSEVERNTLFTNSTCESIDLLVAKLMLAEVQRWYNRGLQLLCNIRRYAVTIKVPSNMVDAIEEEVKDAECTLDHVLRNVLDDSMHLLPLDEPARPGPLKAKKFEIYLGMQQSIMGLINSIIASKRMPPRWQTRRNIALMDLQMPTCEELTMSLLNIELETLNARILQLWRFIELHELPGTVRHPHVEPDSINPGSEQRFKELVAVKTFSMLARQHFEFNMQQKEVMTKDERGEVRVELIPRNELPELNIKDFLRAVGLRKKSTAKSEEKRMRWGVEIRPILRDGPRGPYMDAVVVDVDDDSHDNKNNSNDDSGNNNSSSMTLSSNSKERQEHDVWMQRHRQLCNYINDWGIKGSYTFSYPKSLRHNASLQSIKSDVENTKSHCNTMVKLIQDRGKTPPKMPKTGGQMRPRSA